MSDYVEGLREFAAELNRLADDGDPAAIVRALAQMCARGSDVSAEIRLSAVRRDAVTAVVIEEGGNQRAAADRLGLSGPTVSRLLLSEEERRQRGRRSLVRKAERDAARAGAKLLAAE